MAAFDWKEKYKRQIGTAEEAMRLVKAGDRIFIGSACGQPQHLVNALVEHGKHVYDAHIIHLLTMGSAPYAEPRFREKFKMNSFFVADNVRHALEQGIGDYTPIFSPTSRGSSRRAAYRSTSPSSRLLRPIRAGFAVSGFPSIS